MADDPDPRDIAAAWRPERPGKRDAKDIPDALVEPAWGGIRVAVSLTPDKAAVYRAGEELDVLDTLLAALVVAFDAVDAVVTGNLTTKALEDGVGVGPALTKVERPPILIPRAWRKNVKDDPYIQARDFASREDAAAKPVQDALAAGVTHAFVATDLLWLDGMPLGQVPLQERKRLLDGILAPSELVRVTPFVKRSAILTLVTWGQLGFAELSYRAANSRYAAGSEQADWAVSRPPEGPHGPAKGPVPAR